MALITRCPVCGTRFKVVPDQLRISDGWVRCGECAEVFDASADLTQSENEPLLAPHGGDAGSIPDQPVQSSWAAAPEVDAWNAVPEAASPGGSAEHGGGGDGGVADAGYGTGYVWSAPPSAQPVPNANPEASFQPVLDRPSVPSPELPVQVEESAAEAEHERDPDTVAAPWDPAFDEPADEVPRAAEPDEAEEVPQSLTEFPADMSTLPEDTVYMAPPPAAEVDAALDAQRPLSFLKAPDAPVETLWQRPWMRRSLAVLSALLALTLGAQVLLQQRDAFAGRLPGAKPLLQALCLPFGCTVEALRQIESVVIDSSTFTTVRHGVYRLNVVLKNRATTDIAVPAIELALTDTQEQAVLRRVLQPADMGGAPGTIAPNAEWTASLELGVAEEASIARIVGYRLLAFYP